MEMKSILTELRLFKLTNFLAAFTLWGRHFVKPTSSTVYSGSFFKQGINFVDIMKICMWSFGGNKVKFDRRITAF